MALSAAGPESDNSRGAAVPLMAMKSGEEESQTEMEESDTYYSL